MGIVLVSGSQKVRALDVGFAKISSVLIKLALEPVLRRLVCETGFLFFGETAGFG